MKSNKDKELIKVGVEQWVSLLAGHLNYEKNNSLNTSKKEKDNVSIKYGQK